MCIGEVFDHNYGQVEIDALFVEKRNGEALRGSFAFRYWV